MTKAQIEANARKEQAVAMNRKIDSLRISASEETRKALDIVLHAGLDAYFNTMAGLQ